MFIMAALHTPVVMIPVAIPFFFISATAGVFGNARGGWKGLRAGRLCDRRTDFRRPGHYLPDHAERGPNGTSFPGKRTST